MSKKFIDSGWEFQGTDQVDGGVDLGPVSAAGSHGSLHLKSDFNQNVTLKFNAYGAGVGKSPSPVDISGATKEMSSAGVVLANPVFRKSLSLDDFSGACLIQSYIGSLPFAPASAGSVAVIFFDVDKGIITSLLATAATAGVFALGAHATIIASCSALVACAGIVASTPQVGASVMLGYIRLEKGTRGSEKLCAYPWRVTTNGKNYSYIFHEDGRCYWYEYKDLQISPDGKGNWRVITNKDGVDFLEIKWESGSKERWNLPISLISQTGTWQTKDKKQIRLNAKHDLSRMTLIHKTLKS